MQELSPILVADRFPPLLNSLLDLLERLSDKDWDRPTVAAGWSVQDVALHLLGDDLGILARKRDHFSEPLAVQPAQGDLVQWLNRRNSRWVKAMRRISPRLTCDLLRFTGEQVNLLFASMDPLATGGPVSWAGPEPAPVWLDIAREFTERWHHQQHIRDAVGRVGCKEPYYLGPVLSAFVHAMPHALCSMLAAEGTVISLTIVGESGGQWSVSRQSGKWRLYLGKPEAPDAEVVMPEDTAWRLFTKGISIEQARLSSRVLGDPALAGPVFEMTSIIA